MPRKKRPWKLTRRTNAIDYLPRQQIKQPQNHTHHIPPHHLTIQLINWQVLAGKDSQLKEDKLTVACQAAQNSKVDIILGTELGTTPMTEPLKEGPYISDWSTHPSTKAGQGVGAFFSQSASFSWAPLSIEKDDTQSRFYHLKHNNQNLLLGIFYAPMRGNRSKNAVVTMNLYYQHGQSTGKHSQGQPEY